MLTGEQNKATKDIIRNIMSDAHEGIWHLAWMKEAVNTKTSRGYDNVVPLTEEQKKVEIFYFED